MKLKPITKQIEFKSLWGGQIMLEMGKKSLFPSQKATKINIYFPIFFKFACKTNENMLYNDINES